MAGKIIITIIITAFIVFAMLSSNSIVGNLLRSTQNNLLNYWDFQFVSSTPRDLPFNLDSKGEYDSIHAMVSGKNVTINADGLEIKAKDSIVRGFTITIADYTGSVDITDDNLFMQGSYSHIITGQSEFLASGDLQINSTFKRIFTEMLIDRLAISHSKGRIIVSNSTTFLNEDDIVIRNMLADTSVEPSTQIIKSNGTASLIYVNENSLGR